MQANGEPASKALDRDTALIVESAEGRAWADWYAAAPAESASAFGLRAEQRGSSWVFVAPALPAEIFNRALGVGLAEPTDEAEIDLIVETLHRAGSPRFAVQPSPLARPEALPTWLEARGLRLRSRWAKMMRGAEPPPAAPTDLRVEEIGIERAGAFGRIAAEAFGLPAELAPCVGAIVGRPRWRAYAAQDGDEAVAVGALFVHGEVGWLGFAGTLASHRRRGAQSAIMARRIGDALALGCRLLVTETGEDSPEHPNPSLHNMLRMGFRLAYLRPSFEHPAE